MYLQVGPGRDGIFVTEMLIGMREEEQKIIDVSGDSYSTLQKYEKDIKAHDEKERQLYRERNGIEKESVAIIN